MVGVIESAELRYKADVVAIKFGLVMKHRSFYLGGERGMRPEKAIRAQPSF